MGLMNRLRDKTHIILIILVIAFLATIVFEWGMNYLGLNGGNVMALGVVNGDEITYQEFESRLQFAIEQQKQQTGEELDETAISMMRDQVWDQLVTEKLATQQIEKLGIRVTDQEIINWVYNSPQTLPEPIKRNFIDSTGEFNMGLYQQVLTTQTPEIQQFWTQVEDYLKQVLLSQKLQSVITGVVRVSESEVKQNYIDQNIAANIDYILFDVNALPDQSIQITDEELRSYYEKNKEDFRIEESAKLKYVMFSDLPTVEDTNITERDLNALKKDLRTAKDSALIELVNSNSENKWNDNFLKPNELSPQIADYLFNATVDSVSNVIKASDGFHVVRLLEAKDGTESFTNASHILVNFGTDTNAAKAKAEQLISRLKNGEDFAKLASELSDDQSAKQTGGNLGWFTKGAMVKEFEDVVLSAKVNEITGPVKTQFGFHIIKVHDRRSKVFKVADIKKTVKTSTRTRDIILKRAEDFSFVATEGNFEVEAKKLGFQILEVPSLTKTGFIPGVGQNKKITDWAFREKINTVSGPFKVRNGYAVYQIVEKREAGYYGFDEIKETMIRPKLLLEKKLDIIKSQATDSRAKLTSDNIRELSNLNPAWNVMSADSISATKPDPQIGTDPAFNSVVFKMQPGQISEPIRTQRGYYIVQVKSITPFDEQKYQAASNDLRISLLEQKKQQIVTEWLENLKNSSEIVDNRDKFFR